MNHIWQQTIEHPTSFEGIGLHSGKPVTLRFVPAEANSGIVFIRTDLPGAPEIKALADRVTSAVRATTLTEGEAYVFTVEHVIAALYMSGIDNCRVEMDSPEPPAADGSSQIFCQLINEAGKVEQKEKIQWLEVKEPFQVYDNNRYIVILPYDDYRISFTSENSHPELGTQYLDLAVDHESCLIDIAPARTIGFVDELEVLKSKGLALGGSLENALVYDQVTSLNTPRFSDELVRHKVLDVIGDIALCGFRIKGHVIAVQSAHLLNTQLALKLMQYAKNGLK